MSRKTRTKLRSKTERSAELAPKRVTKVVSSAIGAAVRRRHDLKSTRNPLVVHLKKQVKKGQINLRRYGHVPKKPRLRWWSHMARRIYGKQAVKDAMKELGPPINIKREEIPDELDGPVQIKREETPDELDCFITGVAYKQKETLAERIARRASEANANPLVMRVKKDFLEGNFHPKAFGPLPENPTSDWWLKLAKKAYEERAGTILPKKVNASGHTDIADYDADEEKLRAGLMGGIGNVRKAATLRDEKERLKIEEKERELLAGETCPAREQLAVRKLTEANMREMMRIEAMDRIRRG